MRPEFLRRARIQWLDWAQVALAVWTVILLAVCARSALQPRTRSLYYTYATAGADWVAAGDLYHHDNRPACLDQYRYCPAVAASLTPLAYVNERLGNILWRLFNAGVFLGGLLWWLRTLLPGRGPWTGSLKGMLCLLAAPLALGSLNNGQTNPLVIGFLLMAVAAAHAERWNGAALIVALACALKLYPIAVGLLLVVVYPRQLGWRLALALALVAALPYLCQRPGYVTEQYRQLFQLLAADDRKHIQRELAYRDLWLLLRFWEVPVSPRVYLGIQTATAAGCAALCWLVRRAEVRPTRAPTAALTLGTCWMMLCGPATESSSFIQLAPALAWAIVAARLEKWPVPVRWLPRASFALFMGGVLAGLTPYTKEVHSWGIQPLATLLLFVAYVAETARALFPRQRQGAALPDALPARAA